MVLQRAPARARIWGYGFNVGDTVTVTISGGGEYQTTTTEGMDTLSVWFIKVVLYIQLYLLLQPGSYVFRYVYLSVCLSACVSVFAIFQI